MQLELLGLCSVSGKEQKGLQQACMCGGLLGAANPSTTHFAVLAV